MSEPTISLRAIIKDETAAQLQAMAENVKRVTQAIGAGSSATIAFVQAEKSLTPAVKEATEAQAQAEIVIKRYKPEVDAATASTARQSITVEQSAAFVRSQAAAIAETSRRMRESISATQAKMSEEEKLSNALGDSILKLKAQKDLLNDPVFTANLRRQQSLRAEINQMTSALTEVTGAHVAEKAAIEAGDEAVKLTVRSRRELIVLAHELSQGRYKNFGGSLMVLEEGAGGIKGALQGAIAMMGGPYVAAAGAAALATAGVGIALWKTAEHAAEMVHKAELLGEVEGVTAQTMLGLQYMTVGTGASVDQLGKAFGRFTENLAANSNEARKVGITAKDPIQAFGQLMEVIKNTADVTERDKIAKDLLGVGWQKLIPILKQGKDGLDAAMVAMQIPEGTMAAYERANKAQIEIDKAWLAIKLSSGGYFSELRASLKEFEAKLLGHSDAIELINKKSRERYELAVKQHALDGQPVPTEAQMGIISKAGAAAILNGAGAAKESALTDDQQKAIDWARKQNAKDSLQNELTEVRKEFLDKAKAFEEGSKHYLEIMDQEKAKEAEVRKKWAKKGAGSRGPSESQIETNVARNFDGSVTMRSGLEYEAGPDAEHLRNRATAERTDDKNGNKKVADAKKLHDEVQRISEKNLADNQKLEANAQKIRMDWEGALLEKKKKAHEEEMKLIRERADVGQKLASDQVYKMLQGEFTIQGAVNATKDVMFRAFADTTTKWIEEQILKMVFAKSSEAASTAASVAQASIVASAWAPASMATSIGTFGASTAAGSASWFTAMTSAQGYGMMPHERGGMMFGTGLKQREEQFTPLVPGRVSPIQNSTTNTTNQSTVNHYHFHGYGERDIQRVMRTAKANGAGVSRR